VASVRLTDAIRWIARNDEPQCFDETEVESLVTVNLIADLFGKPAEEIANAVINTRRGIGRFS